MLESGFGSWCPQEVQPPPDEPPVFEILPQPSEVLERAEEEIQAHLEQTQRELLLTRPSNLKERRFAMNMPFLIEEEDLNREFEKASWRRWLVISPFHHEDLLRDEVQELIHSQECVHCSMQLSRLSGESGWLRLDMGSAKAADRANVWLSCEVPGVSIIEEGSNISDIIVDNRQRKDVGDLSSPSRYQWGAFETLYSDC
jgi:hypothetical protein